MYTLLSTSLYTCLWPNLPCYIEWGVWGFCGNLKIGEHNTIWAGQSNSRWDFGGVSFCVFHRRVCTVPPTHSALKCGKSVICLRVKNQCFCKKSIAIFFCFKSTVPLNKWIWPWACMIFFFCFCYTQYCFHSGCWFQQLR